MQTLYTTADLKTPKVAETFGVFIKTIRILTAVAYLLF